MKSAMPNLPGDDEINPLETMLRLSCFYLKRESDPFLFLNWFTSNMPLMCDFFEGFNFPPGHTEQDTKAMWRGMGRMIYSQIPIPSFDYRLKKIPEPGRNDPCDCGSGNKYKHCCANANQSTASMPMINGLRYLLDELTAAKLADIAGTHADLDAVAATAHDWTDEGQAKRSAALLEPYFKGETPLSNKLDLLFDELMSALYELDKPRKRQDLIKQVLLRGDKALQSTALQRRATMHCDANQYDQAWIDFQAAMKINPNDPSLSHLEVLILTAQGKLDQAKTRAQFWVKWLKSLRDDRYEDLIAYLEKCALDPIDAGLHAARGAYPALDELCELMAQAPAPQSFYSGTLQTPHHPRFGGQGIGTLEGEASMVALQNEWRTVFAQVKPFSSQVQNDAPQVWDNAVDWLKLLRKKPQLWNCFDVLDDLVMAVECLPVAGVLERVVVPLGERAAELLQLTLEKLSNSPAELMGLRCEWIVGDNRPALRPIAHLAFLCQLLGNTDRFMSLAHWFVFGLNPNDNHGFRDALSNAFIHEDRHEEALQLSLTYPEDAPNIMLNGVLALRCLGRMTEAAKALKIAYEHYPKAVKMLLKDKVKPVKSDPMGIEFGGDYQAWMYYDEMREDWLIAGAIAWAKTVLK